jgi:AcrR family transcriptional regulator
MSEIAPPHLRIDAQRNRERLLVAAAELFRTRGLDVSMEDIAYEAGVGVGTLYRRFRNRDELIDALFESRLADFADVVRGCAAIADGWIALVSMLERTLELQAADRGLKHLFHSREHTHAAVAGVRDLVLDKVQEMMSRAQAAGQMRRDVEPMDVAVLSIQVGAIADLTAEQDPGAWRRALAIALDGLRARHGERDALPPGPIDRETLEVALQRWRPPAIPAS